MNTPAALHSARSDLWYTPLHVLNRVRAVLPLIELDPASDEFGNSRVGALRYLTREDDALSRSWEATGVFLNPPGGKTGNQSKSRLFWRKLVQELDAGHVGHAIFLAFSLEQLQVTQDGEGRSIGDFPFCIPSRRLAFDAPGGETGTAPSHSNCIVYLPGRIDRTRHFADAFRDLGAVVGART